MFGIVQSSEIYAEETHNIVRNTKRYVLTALLALAGFSAAAESSEAHALRIVQAGDSVGSIAQRYRVPVDTVLGTNSLDGRYIHVGDRITVPLDQGVGGPAEIPARLPPGFRWHALQAGETLSTVASRFGIPLNALVGANTDISSLDRLPVGVDLLIPPGMGTVVTLRPGDSIIDVAHEHHVAPYELVRANGLRSPLDIVPGMLVFLPGVQPTAALERLAKVREEENRFIWPLHGRLTSYFGPRNLGMGTSSFHRGIDIAAPTGTPIVSMRSGTVTFAGWSTAGYGNLVRIRHAEGYETWYGHFSSVAVSVGQAVSQGQVIGRVGSTGISTGPHLHLEVRQNGTAIDPFRVLP